MNNLQLSEKAGVSNFIFAFTKNGQTSGDPFFDPLIPAPINPPISGNVIDVVSNPSTTYTSLGEYLYATPVGAFLSAWGVDPNVNGFVMGMEVQAPNSPVPEPSSLALCAAGVFSLTSGSWWRRRRPA